MRTYIRDKTKGGCYFLTVNVYDRQSNLLSAHINELRQAFKKTKRTQTFEIDACVVLPDHFHIIITLPHQSDDYSKIISAIKGNFSRLISKTDREVISSSRAKKRERGLWQRRFWEHKIRDDKDYKQHIDYIHYNPVKHGYVSRPTDWAYSTIHKFISDGVYPIDWGSNKIESNIFLDYD